MTGTDTPMMIAKGGVVIVIAVMWAVFMLVMEVVESTVVLEAIITRKVMNSLHVRMYVCMYSYCM